MKTLILMQGIPGSGKSTVVKGIRRAPSNDGHYGFAEVCSTDDFWMKDGKYNFDPSLLGVAHQQNQAKAKAAMAQGIQSVIIDNTNIKKRDVEPYVAAAKEYGYTVQVVRVSVDPEVAIARQLDRPEDRRIPEAVIRRMYSQMEDLI